MPDKVISHHSIYARAVPRWDVLAVARLIADATLTEAKAQGQIRRFAQRRWVPTIERRGTGKNAANLFGPAAVAGAKILSVLTELGIDPHIIEQVWPVLFRDAGLHLRRLPEGEHPVLRATLDAVEGKPWMLQIDARRSYQTGALFVRAFVYEPAQGPPPSWVPDPGVPRRATVILDLASLLLPLHNRFMESMGGAAMAGP